jgi:hypothetical protein
MLVGDGQVVVSARVACFALMLGANACMTSLFVKGLQESGSVPATVISFAVNFVLTVSPGLRAAQPRSAARRSMLVGSRTHPALSCASGFVRAWQAMRSCASPWPQGGCVGRP